MLRPRRWPAFIWKVLLVIVAPQRVALRAELRAEKWMDVCRRLNDAAKQFEIDNAAKWQQIAAAHANEKKTVREVYDAQVKAKAALIEEVVKSREELRRQLADEQGRHAETKQSLADIEGRYEVLQTQLDVLVQWRETELERLRAEARIQALRGHKPKPEEPIE